jgi:O-acetyl-ADP-ribose deacetylase (regulator of RNase III)
MLIFSLSVIKDGDVMIEKTNTILIIKQGDITKEKSDAIVNPANSQLQLGGGVAGAILKAGGYSIQEECNKIGNCPLGQAVITTAGNLPSKFVIHTVGPRYNIDTEPEKHLYNAVYNSLLLADKNNLNSISLPAISTGIFGYPMQEAAQVILTAIDDFIKSNPKSLKTINLVLFSKKDLEVFKK